MNLFVTLKRLVGAFVIFFIATSSSANAAAHVVVPGCAPIHPPTCIQWKKVDGEGWSVRNNCGASVSVMLDKTSSTPILSPGQVWLVGIKPPQYLVFDTNGWDRWFKSVFKGSHGQFWNEEGFPCNKKLLVAQQSGETLASVSSSSRANQGSTSQQSGNSGAVANPSAYQSNDQKLTPPPTSTTKCPQSVQFRGVPGYPVHTFIYEGSMTVKTRNEESGAIGSYQLDQIEGSYTHGNWADVERWAACHLKTRRNQSTGGNGTGGSQRQAAVPTTGSGQSGGLARPSSGQSACKGSKEFCEVQQCQQRGGRPYAHTDNLGCRVVTCGFADTGRNYGTVISAPPGAGCAGYSK